MHSMNVSLQENVMTLLCFDTEASSLIRGAVTPDLFEGEVYQTIAIQALDFIDKYKEAPKDHLPDLLEPYIQKASKPNQELYRSALLNLYQFKESINKDYTLNQLLKFIRQQKLKQVLTSAVKSVQVGDAEQAEKELSEHLRTTFEAFDIGLEFSNFASSYESIFGSQSQSFPTGIPGFDELNIGPAPKELFMFLTLPNRGKTWWLIHLAKNALIHRKKVLFLTLEMSEHKIAGRILQNMFSITRKKVEKGKLEVQKIKKDSLGRFIDFEPMSFERPSFQDPDILKFLNSKMDKLKQRFPLVVKQFPTGQLSTRGLEAYLDLLDSKNKFVPDLICIDYPDLMSIDTKNLRVDTGRLYRDIRGIGVERNLAVAAVSQSNKEGKKEKWINMENFAEDFSKAGISDAIITYNQTDVEYQLGLARLLVAKARDESRNRKVLISQSYATGQFALDSVVMEDKVYFKALKDRTEDFAESEE